ncbi:MAG: DUF58 domain-containing protein [Gammaproteobacteria bacterium]|nr:DUF58 domain-containing protein [Gammaproteobacteria bacterium]
MNTDTSQAKVSTSKPSGSQSAVSVSIAELIALKASIKGISLISARVKNSSITGAHASRFRGRGMDYQESRAYQPGDDIRSMDWRVTARAGIPYVKMYEEERERPVMLLIDLNPGMFFATQGAFKSVIAARIAALIAWAAVSNGDRIGALIFNGKHLELPPRGGAKGALHLFRQLVQATNPRQGMQALDSRTEPGHLDKALKRCRRVSKPGSLIFILSDFYNINEETKAQLLRLRQHNDVVAMQIVDPLEQAPPPAALYGVSDGVQTGIIDTRNRKQQDNYSNWCRQHHASVEQVMRKRAIPLLRISTTEDAASALRRYFSTSGSRKSRASRNEMARENIHVAAENLAV